MNDKIYSAIVRVSILAVMLTVLVTTACYMFTSVVQTIPLVTAVFGIVAITLMATVVIIIILTVALYKLAEAKRLENEKTKRMVATHEVAHYSQ